MIAQDRLVHVGLLTQQQYEICLAQHRSQLQATGKAASIADLAIRNRFVTRSQINDFAADGSASADEALALLATDVCVRHQVVPVRAADGVLVVRAARRLSEPVQAALIAACSEPVAAVKTQAVDKLSLRDELEALTKDDYSFIAIANRIRNETNGSSLRLAIDAMLAEALRARASDIHLDRNGDLGSWVSMRIDGVLQQRHLLPERVMSAIMTRIKTDAGMDASNVVRTQDGRISMLYRGRNIDFRVATQPIVGGETIALRILDAEALPELEEMFPGQLSMTELFRSLSSAQAKRGGIVLVTGATGSGKSTTLYALAKMLPRDRVNLMTVEDPVEYALPFARQIQLNQLLEQEAGDFERSLLRQDPDVILLGEIRDGKSARAAIKFAESGHMVLATLHADGALEVFERLSGFFEEGAEKKEALYLLAQQLRVSMHQQLVPKLCSCSIALDRDESDVLAQVNGVSINKPARHRIGCPLCGETGIKGRVLAHETLVLPRSISVRMGVHDLLQEGLVGLQRIATIDGVTFQSRQKTIERLLEAGCIDFEETKKVLS